ncbi:MAG: cytochrome c [Lysobacteraceae bacterium]
MTLTLRLATVLALLIPAAPLLAAGDVEAGKLKAYTCTGCHGVTGYRNAYPHYHVPLIGGQNREYLVTALTAYQKGVRKHPTMRAQSESFSTQDIEDIAAYLSSVGGQHDDSAK